MTNDTLKILQDVQNLIVDMDGVLWRGAKPLPGLADFFAFLRRKPINFVLATNNASKTITHYIQRLEGCGIEITPQEIITSAQATAEYLAEQTEPGTPIYVIGMTGLRQPLMEHGFRLLDDHKEPGHARYVVVGWDRNLTYTKLTAAALHIRAGATFIGTNPDPTWPSERGQAPGTGATLAALQTATKVEPTVIGKPSPLMFQIAMGRMRADAAHTAMIGDRLTTDIAGAKNAGLKTVLLLSGVTSPAALAASMIQPDLSFENLAALIQVWEAIQST